MVGGNNAPKKLYCMCSDGKLYPQLLKGCDDLRQDACMQQVFTIMNDMLRSDQDTSKRKLNVRTYKVVPMSQRSGVLEWCANTLTLASYLIGTKGRPGAHRRFHPKDLKPSDCRLDMHVSFYLLLAYVSTLII